MASSKTRTISFLVSTAFPGAYFLDDALWQVEQNNRNLEALSKESDIENPARVQSYVREAISRAQRAFREDEENLAEDRSYPLPIEADGDLVFVRYDRVHVRPGYDIFVCPSCDLLYNWNQAETAKFTCSNGHKPTVVAQLAHLFVHSVCGSISQIQPKRCWNLINGENCGSPLRLHLSYQQMGESYWWCPKCRNERHFPANSREDVSGWILGELFAFCQACSTDERRVRMNLTPARTALKAQRIDVVDMPSANYQEILREWFGGEQNEELALSHLPPNLHDSYRNSATFREEMNRILANNSNIVQNLPTVEPGTQEELSNLSGAKSAIIRRDTNLSEITSQLLANKFGLSVSLLDNLGIVRCTYGHLVGNASPAKAVLKVFPMRAPRYAVLTQRLPTEALLFELRPEKVARWLNARGMQVANDEKQLRRFLVTCADNDPILREINWLIHTASHALRRSSERYTGMGRDVVDELLFPRGMAFVLFNNRGSELGMFTTTFEGRLREWLTGTEYDLQNCPFDPICMNENIAACPGCLHVGERGCTTLWNQNMDRRFLVNLPSSTFPAYWDG